MRESFTHRNETQSILSGGVGVFVGGVGDKLSAACGGSTVPVAGFDFGHASKNIL